MKVLILRINAGLIMKGFADAMALVPIMLPTVNIDRTKLAVARPISANERNT